MRRARDGISVLSRAGSARSSRSSRITVCNPGYPVAAWCQAGRSLLTLAVEAQRSPDSDTRSARLANRGETTPPSPLPASSGTGRKAVSGRVVRPYRAVPARPYRHRDEGLLCPGLADCPGAPPCALVRCARLLGRHPGPGRVTSEGLPAWHETTVCQSFRNLNAQGGRLSMRADRQTPTTP